MCFGHSSKVFSRYSDTLFNVRIFVERLLLRLHCDGDSSTDIITLVRGHMLVVVILSNLFSRELGAYSNRYVIRENPYIHDNLKLVNVIYHA
jgi:hypothetical protein